MRFVFNVLGAAITFVFALVAGFGSLGHRQTHDLLLVLLASGVVAGLAIAVFRKAWGPVLFGTMGVSAVAILVWLANAPTFPDLEREGHAMVTVVEDYRLTHGFYPESLEATGIVPPSTRYGPWRYEREGLDVFTLKVGVYSVDGFLLMYCSRFGKWSTDT